MWVIALSFPTTLQLNQFRLTQRICFKLKINKLEPKASYYRLVGLLRASILFTYQLFTSCKYTKILLIYKLVHLDSRHNTNYLLGKTFSIDKILMQTQ